MEALKKEALKKNVRYTYGDYEKWGDEVPRCELIDGIVYDMAAPNVAHQSISGNLFVQLHAFLKDKPCRVFAAPFDVRLNFDTADDIVVQPDILVICDKSKIENGKHCLGAPDFVIEVLSPSNSRHETIRKLEKYLEFGVSEYWVVDFVYKTVVAHRLVDNQYVTVTYSEADHVPVLVLEGCTINLNEVFV